MNELTNEKLLTTEEVAEHCSRAERRAEDARKSAGWR